MKNINNYLQNAKSALCVYLWILIWTKFNLHALMHASMYACQKTYMNEL